MTGKKKKEKLNWWPLCWVTYLCSWLLGNMSCSGCQSMCWARLRDGLLLLLVPLVGCACFEGLQTWCFPTWRLSCQFIFSAKLCAFFQGPNWSVYKVTVRNEKILFFRCSLNLSCSNCSSKNERCELSCFLQKVIKHLNHLKDYSGVWALEQGTVSDMAETNMQGGCCTTEC